MDESQRVLSTVEERILAAFAERIFPRTDTPGAVEIGAIDYIQIALAGGYAPLQQKHDGLAFGKVQSSGSDL